MNFLFYTILGYFMGSILFGYIIPKGLKGIDIREVSKDGNPGTANSFSYAGIWCGILVLICDMLKGGIPVYLAKQVLDTNHIYFAFVIMAPVLGHAFPAYTKFKNGGKGIAVSFGVLIGLYPKLSYGLLLAFWYIFFSIICNIKPHSYRTVVTYVFWVMSEMLLKSEPAILIGSILIAIIVYSKHLREIKSSDERQIRLLLKRS